MHPPGQASLRSSQSTRSADPAHQGPHPAPDLLDRVEDDVPEVLNTISSLLTLEAIQTMNEASAVNRLDSAQVAQRFLEANDLL